MSYAKILALAGLTLVAAACGSSSDSITRRDDAGPEPDADPKKPQDAGAPDLAMPDAATPTELLAGVVGTDYTNPGVFGLFRFDPPGFVAGVSLPTHSDAVVRGFPQYSNFVVLNRFLGDSLQVIDPIAQTSSEPISTGSGSNPWDLVLVGAYAYVARYDLGNVIKLNRETGAIEATIDMSDYVNNDPKPAITVCNGEIFVGLQNLAGFSVDSPGRLVVIDPALDAVVRDYELGFNPAALAVSEPRGTLYSSNTGSYTSPKFPASVQEIDPTTGAAVAIDLNGVNLGNPGDIAISGETGYVVGGFPSAVYTFSLAERRFTGEAAFTSEGFIAEIALAGTRLLVVDGAGLWVRDLEKGTNSGPFTMKYPTVSVAVTEVPIQ